MTWQEVQNLAEVYLGGDYKLPKDEAKRLVALQSAFYFAADKCTALKLLTVNKQVDAIIRMGPGDTYVRMPKLPKDPTDHLDIDSELCPAVARVVSHYVAKDVQMKEYHKREALEIMRSYEAKVQEYMQEMDIRGKYDKEPDNVG